MKKKLYASVAVIVAFTLIYSLATAIYYTCTYRTLDYIAEVDAIFEGYFYLMNIPGILAVSLFMRKNYTTKRMFIAYSVSLLSVAAVAFLLFLPLSKSVFILILFLVFILFGCAQGAYVFLMVLYAPRASRCLVFGIAAALSVIINALFALIEDGEFVKTSTALVVYSVIGIIACVILWFSLNRFLYHEESEEESGENAEKKTPSVRSSKVFLIACLFIAFSWMIQSLGFYFPYNGGLVLGINNEVLRITNVLGLLLGGYVNMKDKRISAVSCLIILATPMLYIFLQAQAEATLVVFLLSYFFTGFLSVYRFGIVADMSDSIDVKGNRMTWVCTFGLMFGRLGEGIGGLLGIELTDNTTLLLTVTCFVLVIAVALFIFHYSGLFVPVPQVVKKHEDTMADFKKSYDLSGREMDVLELLIDDNSNTEIAEKLFISENTVKFHVRNILKKTGCKNRKEIGTVFRGTDGEI